MFSLNILLDKSDTIHSVDFGAILKKINDRQLQLKGDRIGKPKYVDWRELVTHVDIQIHMFMPIFGGIPWSHTNILVLNSQFDPKVIKQYLHAFDAVFVLVNVNDDMNDINDNTVHKLVVEFERDGYCGDIIYIINSLEDDTFIDIFKKLGSLVEKRKPSSGHFHCPPVLSVDECQPISIITPTFNRPHMFDIALHNILSTDYPINKIEWVIIEDFPKPDDTDVKAVTVAQGMDIGSKLMGFKAKNPQIELKYIPLENRVSIGEKRNIGVEHATHDIILFMDDDDNYPITSFRRRVAWLTKGVKAGVKGAEIACCTTLALYDLKRGISAVNVPPYNIPFSQRISEATLTFKKSAWISRKFQDVSVAEGGGWIDGRETSVIEIPPQQIIVAFSHGDNKSSRQIPSTENPPGCFWGFPKEYLIFIHKLVGVEVEDSKNKDKAKQKKH